MCWRHFLSSKLVCPVGWTNLLNLERQSPLKPWWSLHTWKLSFETRNLWKQLSLWLMILHWPNVLKVEIPGIYLADSSMCSGFLDWNLLSDCHSVPFCWLQLGHTVWSSQSCCAPFLSEFYIVQIYYMYLTIFGEFLHYSSAPWLLWESWPLTDCVVQITFDRGFLHVGNTIGEKKNIWYLMKSEKYRFQWKKRNACINRNINNCFCCSLLFQNWMIFHEEKKFLFFVVVYKSP